MKELTAEQLRTRFPKMPEATVQLNASDGVRLGHPLPAYVTTPTESAKAIKGAGASSITTLSRQPSPRKPTPDLEPTESASQQHVIKWWALVWSTKFKRTAEDDLMAFPLGSARTPAHGARMKAEGMRKGTADLFLAVPRNGKAGLWIEMKRKKGGRVRPEQTAFLDARQANGYDVAVCWSSQEAIRVIEAYLSA